MLKNRLAMAGWTGQIVASLMLMIVMLVVSMQLEAATLNDISYSSLPGDRVQLSLQLSEPLREEPLSFTIDNPARIVLDFPETGLNIANKNQSIGIGVAHSVSVVEAAGRTRVVLNLVSAVPYDMKVAGNTVQLTLGASEAAPVRSSGIADSRRISPASSSAGSVEKIDFRRGPNGEGRILVTLSDPSVVVNMGQEAGQVIVDFLNTNLPEQLNRRLDVIDFATPVKEVDTAPYGNGARMVVSTTSQEYDYLAYQSDDLLTIEVKPLSKAEKEAIEKEKFGYTGERLSLNFQDIEVRAVLQLIADFTGLNMVASDTVTGNLTLRLKNVPWDQALDIILKSKGLGMRRDGNVILVAPQEEIAAREKLELEANKQIEELAPLLTEFVQVNYAKAGDLAILIKAEENNLLSDRGSVTLDARTNTLIIQDVPTSLESIREMINRLDIPVRQVLIESRIVNASENFAKDLGVQFGVSKATRQDPSVTGEDEEGLFVGGGLPGDTAGTATAFSTGGIENFIVSLPSAVPPAGSLKLAYGIIGSFLLQLELNAALAEGRSEDIASPKVITADKSEALIESGVEIPFQEASSSGATTVSFKKAVLALRVTPQITPDDRVLLDLEVDQDTPGPNLVLGVPPIVTNSVSTQVLVDNGETVVLGGVYTQNDTRNSDRVPFFGDLPYLGFLFKRTTDSKTKSELLIFVTPKILKESLRI